MNSSLQHWVENGSVENVKTIEANEPVRVGGITLRFSVRRTVTTIVMTEGQSVKNIDVPIESSFEEKSELPAPQKQEEDIETTTNEADEEGDPPKPPLRIETKEDESSKPINRISSAFHEAFEDIFEKEEEQGDPPQEIILVWPNEDQRERTKKTKKQDPRQGWIPNPDDLASKYEAPLTPPPTTKLEEFDLVDANPKLVEKFMEVYGEDIESVAKKFDLDVIECAKIAMRAKIAVAAILSAPKPREPQQRVERGIPTSTLPRDVVPEKTIALPIVHVHGRGCLEGDFSNEDFELDYRPSLKNPNHPLLQPTNAMPGSPEKMEIMRQRIAKGFPIHQPGDRTVIASSEYDILQLLADDTPLQE